MPQLAPFEGRHLGYTYRCACGAQQIVQVPGRDISAAEADQIITRQGAWALTPTPRCPSCVTRPYDRRQGRRHGARFVTFVWRCACSKIEATFSDSLRMTPALARHQAKQRGWDVRGVPRCPACVAARPQPVPSNPPDGGEEHSTP